MKRIAWIDEYLNGELTDVETQEFEIALETDKALRNELALMQGIDMALSETEVLELRLKLKEISANEIHEAAPVEEGKVIPIHRSFKVLWRVAAAVVLILSTTLILLNTNGQRSEDLYSEYFQAYPSMYNVRSAEQPIELQEVIKAMQPYVEGNYSLAAANLEPLMKRDETRMDLLFYYGICQMEMKNPSEALVSFDKVLEVGHPLLINHVRWYRALALLADNQIEPARIAFAEIGDSNSSFSAKARKIERKLKRR